MHVLFDVAPVEFKYVPIGQERHEANPVISAYCPAAQERQVLSDEAPMAAEYVPRAHLEHEALDDELHSPVPHTVQLVAPPMRE